MRCKVPYRQQGESLNASTGRGVSRVRRLYFAQAGELAGRYGIDFQRVVQHLWSARSHQHQLLLRDVMHVDDLVHAIACIDDYAPAWADLWERYERPLIRRCRNDRDEAQATVLVRRLFTDLRRQVVESSPETGAGLREYAGRISLRNWLAGRLPPAGARAYHMPNSTRQPRRPASSR